MLKVTRDPSLTQKPSLFVVVKCVPPLNFFQGNMTFEFVILSDEDLTQSAFGVGVQNSKAAYARDPGSANRRATTLLCRNSRVTNRLSSGTYEGELVRRFHRGLCQLRLHP